MAQQMPLPAEFWAELERNVSSRVGAALNADHVPRDLVISYLRDLEIMARTACDRRQTIQIIASARSVLGDRTTLGPADGPFAHALA
ncbi:hypothetical protein [Methylobacterium sp. CM6257]